VVVLRAAARLAMLYKTVTVTVLYKNNVLPDDGPVKSESVGV